MKGGTMSEREFKSVVSDSADIKNGPSNNADIKNAISDGTDINALVQEVLREAYLQTTEDLRRYAEKVKYFNQMKKALREYLSSLREFKANAISAARMRNISLCSGATNDLKVLQEIFAESTRPYDVGPIEHELCIPNRIPPEEVTSLTQLDSEIARWETKLNSIGDDVQLANVDLQNILQKQQQALQMMSNISKMVHDTAMEVIRKIGG
jgi:hypothetical protein